MNRHLLKLGRFPFGRLLLCFLLAGIVSGCGELHQLRAETQNQGQEIAKLQKERDQFKKAYYEVVQIREKEAREAHAAQEQFQREKEDVQAELSLQKDQAEAEKQKLLSQIAQEKADRAKTEKGLRDLVDSLKGELAKMREDANALQNNVGALKARADKAEQTVNQVTGERDQAKKDLDALKKQAAEVDQKVAQLQKQLADATASQESQKKAMDERDKTIADQKSEIEKLNQEIVRMRTDMLKAPTKPGESATTHAAEESSAPAGAALSTDQADALVSDMKKALDAGKVPKSDYAVLKVRGAVVIRLSSDWLFQKSGVLLSETSTKDLEPLAAALKAQNQIRIRVEGHTDSYPVRSLPFPDNWGLASTRADAVVRWLESSGRIPGARLTAVGRSRFDPIGDNNTLAGRKKNRRVELWLLPPA